MACVALALLVLLGFYFGRRIQGVFAFFGLTPHRVVFWLVLAGALIAALLTRSSAIGLLLYGILLFALGGLLRLALGLVPGAQGVFDKLWLGGVTPLALALGITLFGYWNAHNPVLKSYQLTLDKELGGLDKLRVVMLADSHLGTVVHADDLPRLVEQVNGQSPDVIALCGDIFEEGTPQALRLAAIEAFSGFEARYGVFYITGNHDSAVSEDEARLFSQSGVTVLSDSYAVVDGRFIIAGRQDGGHTGWDGRAGAQEVLAGADLSLPVIMLDHRPGAYAENGAAGADVQLSGHTHKGQLWPFGLFSGLANGINYGHVSVQGMDVVVTSGYGVWGFPIRTSGRCEYVSIDLLPSA